MSRTSGWDRCRAPRPGVRPVLSRDERGRKDLSRTRYGALYLPRDRAPARRHPGGDEREGVWLRLPRHPSLWRWRSAKSAGGQPVTDRVPYILVVDDDPGVLDSLRFLFEDEGYRVQTTEKGDYAESLRDENGGLPDLIVLDVLLSGKDGRTICRKLKRQDVTRHIPIVMISAYPGAAQSAQEVGADAFVAKPFAIDEVLTTVAALLHARPS